MRSLIIISEAISDDLKQQLIDIIQSPEFTDKQAKKMIRAIGDPKLLIDTLYDYFEERGCEDDTKNIIRILNANDDIDSFIELTNNKDSLPTAKDFIKSKNVYDLFTSVSLSKNTLQELAEERPSKNSITRGAFEILCELLLRDTNTGNKNYEGKAGDVNADGLAIEFKGPQARVKGQKEHNASLIDDEFNKIYKTIVPDHKDAKQIFASQKNMKVYFDNLNVADDVIFEIISKSLQAQYGFNEDLSSLQSSIVKNGKVNYPNVTRLMGCIQLKGYWEDEHWDYICIFHGKKGEQALKKGDYTCISATDASNVVTMFNNSHLTFATGGNGYGSVRDSYCQIYYN